ncbi:MAG: hypothetical protein WCP89_01745 [archaeon]
MGLSELLGNVKSFARNTCLAVAVSLGAVSIGSSGGCSGRMEYNNERFSYSGPHRIGLVEWVDADHDVLDFKTREVLVSFGVHEKANYLTNRAELRVDVKGMNRTPLWSYVVHSAMVPPDRLVPISTEIYDKLGKKVNEIPGTTADFSLWVNFDPKTLQIYYSDSERIPLDPKELINPLIMRHYVNNKSKGPYVEEKPYNPQEEIRPLPTPLPEPKRFPSNRIENFWENDYKSCIVKR